MSLGHDLADLASPALGFTLVHSLWQTGLLALGYAAWRASFRRASVSIRYHVALLALVLGMAAAGASFWSLSTAREPEHARSSAPPESTLAGAVARRVPASLAVPVRTALRSAPDPTGTLDGLAVLWAGGVLLLAVRLLGGLLLAGQIRRRAVPIRCHELHDAQRRLEAKLGIRREVQLLQSHEVDTPVALGWLRPAVLLPTALVRAEAVASLEPLLAHELAHVRAQDYAVNVAQAGLDVLLFFCPGARWLSAEIRRLREYRCDDLAVALFDRPAPYVRALARLAEGGNPSLLAPAATGPRLVDRIRRLSEGEVMPPSRATFLALAASVVVTALLGSSVFSASRLHAARKARPAEALASWTCPALVPSLRLPPVGLFPGNELVPQDTPGRYFYCNPALLDGRPMDWQAFNVETRGTLTLVHGDPSSVAATRIAFSVSLRRDGKILHEPTSALLNRAVFEADLGKVLAFARAGDQLIIDPVNKSDWMAKRIIDLGC